MGNIDISSLINIYIRYGYELKEESDDFLIFVLTQGMYNGADIIQISENSEISESKKKQYSLFGYASILRKYESITDVEDQLFRGFFDPIISKSKVNQKYKSFSEKQVRHISDTAQYTYINAPYNISLPDDEVIVKKDIVSDVIDFIGRKGSYLIIIEAAAGFGKTCTAFEVYNKLISNYPEKRPFLTELSKNRKARIFKYVLLSEINDEFKSIVQSDWVQYHIQNGRIPLIIDGFDELLTKIEKSTDSPQNAFEEVETMLDTIGNLLVDDSKIILTSRRTAVFSSEDFYDWIERFQGKFKVIRVNIDRPNVADWLDVDRFNTVNEKKVPIKHISNPVLLSYLRYIPKQDFDLIFETNDSIVQKYLTFLLEREKERQDLNFSVADQLAIFKNLANIFAELNISSEKRDIVKDIILDFNKDQLNTYLKRATESMKIDDLCNKLVDHCLLDRHSKNGEYIGFVNEFIFGLMIGLYYVEENHKKLNPSNLPDEIAELMITSFEFQKRDLKEFLWELIKEEGGYLSNYNKLIADVKLIEVIRHNYRDFEISGLKFENICFSKESYFYKCVFFECIFTKCSFALTSFSEVSFISCKFIDCTIDESEVDLNERDYVSLFGCVDYDAGFITAFDKHLNRIIVNKQKIDYKGYILRKLFKVDGRTPKMKAINTLKKEIEGEFTEKGIVKDIFNVLHEMVKERYVVIDGNNMFIQEEGINYYNRIR